jgi:hypothetical protein
MTDTARGERLQIMLTQDELVALDNWRFARRMPSRAAAVRELLKRGLANDSLQTPEHRTRSQDFGVIGATGEQTDGATPPHARDGNGRGDSADGHG